jgi:hypothetical protein
MLTGTHRHHGGNRQLMQKIQQAVTTALQQNQATGTVNGAASSDPNKAIENAIVQVLKSNSAAPTSADEDAPGAAASDDVGSQSFLQMLKANGVTPEQFRTDLLAAVQQAGGPASLAKLATNFPPGLLVDEMA